jgi:hypothetical protein
MRVVRCCGRFLNPCAKNKYWRGAGVVEQAGLENRCTLMGTVGSNPTLSAKNKRVSAISAQACEEADS